MRIGARIDKVQSLGGQASPGGASLLRSEHSQAAKRGPNTLERAFGAMTSWAADLGKSKPKLSLRSRQRWRKRPRGKPIAAERQPAH